MELLGGMGWAETVDEAERMGEAERRQTNQQHQHQHQQQQQQQRATDPNAANYSTPEGIWGRKKKAPLPPAVPRPPPQTKASPKAP